MFNRFSGGAATERSLTGPGGRLSRDGPYCAFIGATETHGKFIRRPYPALLRNSLGIGCVNLGCVNAGLDRFLNDPEVQRVAGRAVVTVVAVMGAHNQSNRYYTVHPRRNDRFIRAGAGLQSLYPRVDFADFHFTRHLLGVLRGRDPDQFVTVLAELRTAWIARMRVLLGRIETPTVLLWLSTRWPDAVMPRQGLGGDPLFITRAMVDEMRPLVSDYVECVVPRMPADRVPAGMVFADAERTAAMQVLPPEAHRVAAEALVGPLRRLAV
ncbi:DUF6473 family protein [Rhodovulum sp. YNF3179]|uniref:DUF6473 family protein n=1 Tax=Rhodovulum sp. YNF3179 TaxID=3425127 RepID=UPI003D328842